MMVEYTDRGVLFSEIDGVPSIMANVLSEEKYDGQIQMHPE